MNSFACRQRYDYWLISISTWSVNYTRCVRCRLVDSIHGRGFASSVSVVIFKFEREASISREEVSRASSVIRYGYSRLVKAYCCSYIPAGRGTWSVADASCYSTRIDSSNDDSCTSYISHEVIESDGITYI